MYHQYQLYHEIMRTSYHDHLKLVKISQDEIEHLELGRTIGRLVVNPRERFNLEQKQSRLLVKHLEQKQALRQLPQVRWFL